MPQDDCVLITHGLASSDKSFVEVPLADVATHLKTHRNAYERTMPTEATPTRIHNRVYVDLDGRVGSDTGEEAFLELSESIASAITFAFDQYPHALMTSSKFPKLSFRLTLTKRHGSKEAIRRFVVETLHPILSTTLTGLVNYEKDEDCDETHLPYLKLDTSVYKGNRKMRMLGSSKDGETRPLVLFGEDASVLDTLITYIPPSSDPLPEPTPPEQPRPLRIVDDASSVTNTATNPESLSGDEIEADLIARVLDGLAPKRWEQYANWIRIGFICYNEGLTCDVWERLTTKHYPRYKNGSKRDCSRMWKGFRKSQLTQGTLWRWLAEDNATLYEELRLRRKDFWRLIANSNHAETARFFFNLKPDGYLYHEALGWYALQPTNVWKLYEKTPSGLKSDIWLTLKKASNEASHILIDLDDEERRLTLEDLIGKFKVKIGTNSFVDGVIAFLPACYNDDMLPRKMDESRHLFAFTDRVVDLDAREVREIRPTDYISITTNYPYPKTLDDAKRIRLLAILESIWEDREMVDFILRWLSKALHGTRKEEEFYVWTGSGGNGKGVLEKLLNRAFGYDPDGRYGYYYTIPHSIITKVSDKKDAPCPPLAKCRGKRAVCAQEPEPTDKIQVGIVKELTGGGEITARRLYHDPITFLPQFLLILQTNGIPELNRLDGGIKRRIVIIPFPLEFKDADKFDPNVPSHRRIDDGLKSSIEKDDGLRDAFIRLLLDAYWIEGPLVKPGKVLAATEDYVNENNPVKAWLEEFYHRQDKDDMRYWIGSDELRKQFISDRQLSETAMPREKFKSLMLMNAVVQIHRKNHFTGPEWDELSGTYQSKIRRAGIYWCGLERIRS